VRVLAVAESDAYLKWAAWLLARAPIEWDGELCLVDSVISPSRRQVEAALAGSERAAGEVPMLGAVAVRRRILRDRPDVLLLAATGRTVAAICAGLVGHRRPVVVAGVPGVALPVRGPAVRSRRAVDVFIAHSERERDEFAAAFTADGGRTRVALAGLPFLTRRPLPPPGNGARAVFAAQPSVPAGRDQRSRLLQRLAAVGPPAPLVKLRGEAGEMATHDEPYPYPVLWRELVDQGAVRAGDLEFATGPLADALVDASCLITVSSTAALEAIDRGRPVLVIDDFGVDAVLLNDVFLGSGLIGPLTPQSIAHLPHPHAEWAGRNYFHLPSAENWIDVIDEAVRSNAAGSRSRWFLGDVRSIGQGTARLAAGRWRRRRRR
jgi:hypothetical protein